MLLSLTFDVSSSPSTRTQESGVSTAWIDHTSQGDELGSSICWTHEDSAEYCVDVSDDVSELRACLVFCVLCFLVVLIFVDFVDHCGY